MNKAEIQRKIFLISDRVEYLRGKLQLSECPNTETIFELMSAWEFLTEVKKQVSEVHKCEELMQEIEIVMELYNHLYGEVGKPVR